MTEKPPEYVADALEMIGANEPQKTVTEFSGFVVVFDVIANHYGDPMTALVFGRMWGYCQMEDRVCKASLSTIAKKLHIDKATVSRHAEKLVNDGYLIDLTPDLRNKPHVYADAGRVVMKSKMEAGVAESNSRVAQNNASVAESQLNRISNRDSNMVEVKEKANKKVDAILDQVRNGEGKVSYPKREALPEPIRELIDEFVSISGIKPMAKEVSHWLMSGQDWLNIGATREDVRGALRYAKGKFTLTDPGSLTKTLRSYKTGNTAEALSSPETDSLVYAPPPENPNAMTYEEWMKSKEKK